MSAYQSRYHLGLNGLGYIISQKNGVRQYQKKRAPTFVNKFGGGDSSYRDASFWQYFVQTNWRNGAKQLKFDDPGKFWKSSDVDTTILEELSLSKTFESAGQTIAGGKVNCMEAWRSSANWWDANYGYRQQITITAPAAAVPVGYPIKITVDTAALQTASKVRSDRKDWRVVYFNGNSWVDLARDYVSTTATFFGLQTALSSGASDSNYYIYYGYASESTDKQPTTEALWNAVYGMYGVTPDANSVLIAHFKEGTGTSVADDSAGTNTGTASGSPAWGTDGKLGRYMTFDGSNDFVNFGTSGTLNLGSLTLEGWIYSTNVNPGDENQIIMRSKDGQTGTPAWGVHVNSGGVRVRFDGQGQAGANTLSANTWTHFAVTHDGANTAKIYINGTLTDTLTQNTPPSSSETVFSGYGGVSEYFNGRIQHLRVSNTARTSFPYALPTEPTTSAGTETTTQPPSSTFDLYAGVDNGKVYKWDGTTTWTEQFDTRRVTWFETAANDYQYIGDSGGTEYAGAQSFQITGSQTIKGIELSLQKANGTPGDITVRIETETASKPSGNLANANATLTIPAFTTASYGWISAEFTTAFSLSTATAYWIVVKVASGANDNNYKWGSVTAGGYTGGNNATSADGGGTWTAGTKDHLFRIKGNSGSVNCMKVTSIGGTQKLYLGTGDPASQTNGDARLFSFDGTTWALTKTFVTATESQILSIEEYTANSKIYLGVGPQARVYETSDFSTFTLSKDINIPQNPGYPWTMKEYNRVLHVGGGQPEFLSTQFYNGFLNVYDSTTWNTLYPFDFTVIKSLEFYDAYLFMGTYRGDLYVYDTSSLSPLFNFKDQYNYAVEIRSMKYFNDKLYIGLYPQASSNDTNSGVWLFDRRGLSLAHTISGVTGYRCFANVGGSLMVGTGDNGHVYKLSNTNYKSQGWAQSSYFDANLPSIDKLYNGVTIRHDPLNSGESVVIYYRFKESDSWTTLGTSSAVGAITASFSFPTGTYSKKISLEYELNTTNTSASPKLTEVIMQYSLYPARKWQWTIRIKAKKNCVLLDNTVDTRSAETIRTALEDLLNSQQLYLFTDIDGTTYSVLANDIDDTSWVVNQDSTNEDEVVIQLIEA